MSSTPGILAPGTLFAGYRIERVLGSGGMGTVYAAAHPRLPRLDALKVLSAQHSSDPEFRSRFVREAELVARLEHPNIVGVHDRGIEDDRLWIAMRFVAGTDAAALLRTGGPVPAERAVHIIAAVARGLDHAHRAGMVHRDVKPANILLETIPGQPDRVAITDFGIARGAANSTVLTQAGSVLATLAYAAPEQLTGAPADQRVDVYALGCTLYELLTGTPPYPRPTAEGVIRAHLEDPPPRPSATVTALPAAIDAVIATALAKDPGRRYDSCGALADAAAAALLTGSAPPARPRRPARRLTLALAITATVALAAGAGIYALRLHNGASAEPAAGPAASATALAPDSWGAHEFIVKAFPGLLPATVSGSGFQGLRCLSVDEDLKPIAVTESRDSTNTLSCNGDRNPVSRLVVRCDAKGELDFGPVPDRTIILDEHWQRASGQGRVIVHELPAIGGGGLTGQLLAEFDDGPRKNCTLNVVGDHSGRDLFDHWWSAAPL